MNQLGSLPSRDFQASVGHADVISSSQENNGSARHH